MKENISQVQLWVSKSQGFNSNFHLKIFSNIFWSQIICEFTLNLFGFI
jgi:hypothetical protein